MYRQLKKLVKQQYLLHMSSQYGELWHTNGWDWLASLGHPSKFQRVSHLGFVTALTSLSVGQQNFVRCLAVSWAGTLFIYIFGGCCLLMEFCQVQKSLCVQVLHSPILAALLHGTRAVGVSWTLRRGTFMQQHGHPVRHWAVELSSCRFCLYQMSFYSR